MERSIEKKVSFEDIVFAGRNKLYGAYLLRKLYNRHISVATVAASTVFLLLLSTPLLARLIAGEKQIEPSLLKPDGIVVVIPPPPVDRIVPPPPPPPPAATPSSPPPVQARIKYTPPVVKPDHAVEHEEEIPDVSALNAIEAGTKTIAGVSGGIPDIGIPDGTGTAVIADVVEEPPHIFAEQMPSFPGGERAMFEYLAKNMKYPRQAINAGVEGQVFVSFVVSRTGEISDIQVLRGLGAGCDEEAVRVIKKMPQWTPGKQNGRTVPVRYNLPVRFSLK